MQLVRWNQKLIFGAAYRTFIAFGAWSLPAMATAQSYAPGETFAPFDIGQPVNAYRSAAGLPGSDYWQNRANYQIHINLNPDPVSPSLSGEEVITYTNNSPDRLDALWLQLDQNIYKANSRSSLAGGWPRPTSTDGFVIEGADVEIGGKFTPVHTLASDTRLRVDLPMLLAPKGGVIKLRIRYHFTIPGKWGGRMAWAKARDGAIYDLAQWHPRMAVYDDIRGWDTLPYLAQEFYLEYGDFDYWVTVPSDMLVAGSGELMNPRDVLTATQRARLDQARASDATVMIRAPSEIGDPATRPKQGGTLTWHFHMKDTRDVAFSASSVFAWDAARINLPEGKSALAMSLYPAESQGADRWGRSTEYLKDSIQNFSKRWYPYPWPVAINIAGPASGMEYPGILFDGIEDKGKGLFWITAHEIGHSWFPMIVGFDERRDAWMDEGFNTFIDVYQSDDFNHGEYVPKRDSEFAAGGGNPVDEILPVLADQDAPPILSRSDTVIEKYRHLVTYFKSALGLKLLREEILGPERFDPAFRRFIAAWAYKHPKPADFFRAMESAGGEDLSWWWRGWYAHNWMLDLAIEKIAPATDNGNDDKSRLKWPKGTGITVASHDKLIMPVTLRVEFRDGTQRDYRLPAESWIRQPRTTITIEPGKVVARATLDPDHHTPDRDRSNNSVTPTVQ
ncbi:M1 family metallopeptidase [Novosphingobium sp. KACC 22771]|uniref:M1 family metallopeptidase n=1 Tax=Novosphingobium sp. KACC 22771 TaxID=3025670 RepID=UPI002365EE1D|nr:M1 family metallopeptidase [Novosphingobium sp. KACC 22771]WDF70919.1 M1 family metallopeptidase [Novosphingobium sp. KACC 22771]